ncbi:MAG: response regulator [Bryobacterales bacterium]|nr:response regulator [Bryobacterales bacterium]
MIAGDFETLPKAMLPILIAEDDEQLSRALELYLAAIGFDVSIHSAAGSAKEAMIAEPGRFPLALIDYQLGMDCGIELSRWVLAREPAIRLVLMSGYPPDELMDLSSLGNRAMFLQKPFHPREVISCFRKLHPVLMMSV